MDFVHSHSVQKLICVDLWLKGLNHLIQLQMNSFNRHKPLGLILTDTTELVPAVPSYPPLPENRKTAPLQNTMFCLNSGWKKLSRNPVILNTHKIKLKRFTISKRISLIQLRFNSHWIIRHLYNTFKTQQLFKLFALYFSEISITLFL
jgi:hypothetical protein